MAKCIQHPHRQKVLTALYHIYRGISPFLGVNCRFYPTCSAYVFQVCQDFGILRGSWLSLRRILRCRPGVVGGYDPPPTPHNVK